MSRQKLNRRARTRYLCHAAILATLYIVLTYVTSLFGLASGAIQLRAVQNGV